MDPKMTAFLLSLAVVLGLPEDSGTEAIQAKVKELKKDNSDLGVKLQAYVDADKAAKVATAKDLTSKMIAAGKLPAHLEAMQMKSFEEDFDATKNSVEALLKVEAGAEGSAAAEKVAGKLPDSVASFLGGLGNQKPTAKKFEEYSETEFAELEKSNPTLAAQIIENYGGQKF